MTATVYIYICMSGIYIEKLNYIYIYMATKLSHG